MFRLRVLKSMCRTIARKEETLSHRLIARCARCQQLWQLTAMVCPHITSTRDGDVRGSRRAMLILTRYNRQDFTVFALVKDDYPERKAHILVTGHPSRYHWPTPHFASLMAHDYHAGFPIGASSYPHHCHHPCHAGDSYACVIALVRWSLM